jgi:hypothetical protein
MGRHATGPSQRPADFFVGSVRERGCIAVAAGDGGHPSIKKNLNQGSILLSSAGGAEWVIIAGGTRPK